MFKVWPVRVQRICEHSGFSRTEGTCLTVYLHMTQNKGHALDHPDKLKTSCRKIKVTV